MVNAALGIIGYYSQPCLLHYSVKERTKKQGSLKNRYVENGIVFLPLKQSLDEAIKSQEIGLFGSLFEFIPGDYSKRVYQGVRVKHTVKDLLAEKRSKQTSNSRFNGAVSSSQSAFAQMPGSPAMSGYYGVRRSFLSDSDFHSSKPFPNDGYTPSVAKPFPCEAPLEPCFPEPYADYRSPALGPGAGSLLGASPLPPPPLLPPPFPGDPAHLVLRDSWEQTVPEGLSQPEPLPADALQALPPSASCLSQMEPGGATQHRSSSWAPSLAGAQSYSLHTLEELHHTAGYPTPPPYPFAPFMTMANDLPPKVVSLAPDEGADPSPLHDPSAWTKDDGSMAWGSYECRRAY
ncbi:POU domain class 2-associating factor 2 [Lepus europaeus]|uniref:POU domain class 2-associating factor 2 n=1 Tax=Lepus europaeus TaxID=9983 RepID=UPI002B483F26|nr:POU domain class 2-associating factor 2 [Lepus europaeus]